jgi:hypothetical protein
MNYLKILSGNFDLVKLLELEIAEPWTKVFEIHPLRSLIEHFLEMVSPFPQVANVCFQCQLLTVLWKHEIRFKRRLIIRLDILYEVP